MSIPEVGLCCVFSPRTCDQSCPDQARLHVRSQNCRRCSSSSPSIPRSEESLEPSCDDRDLQFPHATSCPKITGLSSRGALLCEMRDVTADPALAEFEGSV